MELDAFLEKNRLREMRVSKNFRQWHLHLMSGVGLPRISQIENGAPASELEKEKIGRALGVDVAIVWPGAGKEDL